MRNRKGRYEQTARQIAAQAGIPPGIFLSMIEHESGWRPTAVSSAGAIGLGQLMPGTARSLKVDPWNPEQNLKGAAHYLKSMYGRFGNWRDALRAYNQGPNGIDSPQAGASYADAILGGRGAYRNVPQRQFRLGQVPSAPPDVQGLGALAKILFGDQPDFLPYAQNLARVVDVPDDWAHKSGYVDPGGSVRQVPLPKGNIGGVVGAAQSQLGLPYQFGAESPGHAFDCSGLVQWAYAQIGVHLPRTTFDMIHSGREVGWGQLQPGDLIFPSHHHVVMYVGHGKVIAAPHTGTRVQYQDVNSFRNPVAIRRVT